MDQRYEAVLEVMNDGAAPVTDAARRYWGSPARLCTNWLRRYAPQGLGVSSRRPHGPTLSAPSAAPRRSPDSREAPTAPELGSSHHLEPARLRGHPVVARSLVDLSDARAPQAHLAHSEEAQGERLQAGVLPTMKLGRWILRPGSIWLMARGPRSPAASTITRATASVPTLRPAPRPSPCVTTAERHGDPGSSRSHPHRQRRVHQRGKTKSLSGL